MATSLSYLRGEKEFKPHNDNDKRLLLNKIIQSLEQQFLEKYKNDIK